MITETTDFFRHLLTENLLISNFIDSASYAKRPRAPTTPMPPCSMPSPHA